MTRVKRAERRLRATTYHEAGHAVAALALGRRVRSVTVVPDAGRLGACTFAKMPRRFQPDAKLGPRTRASLEDHITVSLAGEVAEHMYTGRHAWSGAADDMRQSLDRASYIAADDREVAALLEWLRLRARNLLATNWSRVELVATELEERGTLTGLEALAAFTSAV